MENSIKLFEEHIKLCAEALEIMKRKNQDYTAGEDNNDPYANFRGSMIFGVHPGIGLMIRMNDKQKRIQSFLKGNKLAVSNESVRDCIVDLINYSVLLFGICEEEKIRQEVYRLASPGDKGIDPLIAAACPIHTTRAMPCSICETLSVAVLATQGE